ncbi:hypothetical protein C0J52_02776 [Blattella germanica]|nr:hypothetical protein C0J52_02776 [Blattella germanica]
MFQGGWGKRAWDELRPMWGKRPWDKFHGAWGKRDSDFEIEGGNMEEDLVPEDLAEEDDEDVKRAWSSWGKRDPGWNNLKGLWGKRADSNWNRLSAAWGKRSIGGMTINIKYDLINERLELRKINQERLEAARNEKCERSSDVFHAIIDENSVQKRKKTLYWHPFH